jgi:hypothetical protein
MPRTARRKSKSKRLDVSAAGVLPTHVPKRWVKFLVGLFLLPPAWILTQTFFTAFARTTMRDSFWSTEEFWFFSLGIVLFLIPFFALPRPLWFYVFGHELTHAVWVLLMGGRVHKFHVTRDGGHILADKTNTFIALAPYFFPIYSLLAIGLYGLAGVFWDVTPYRAVLYSVIGFTWAFHMCFTVWMIPKGQPDLHYGGTFFSLMVIYLLNILILAVLLIIASPQISAISFGRELLHNAVNFTDWVEQLARQMIRLVR